MVILEKYILKKLTTRCFQFYFTPDYHDATSSSFMYFESDSIKTSSSQNLIYLAIYLYSF